MWRKQSTNNRQPINRWEMEAGQTGNVDKTDYSGQHNIEENLVYEIKREKNDGSLAIYIEEDTRLHSWAEGLFCRMISIDLRLVVF